MTDPFAAQLAAVAQRFAERFADRMAAMRAAAADQPPRWPDIRRVAHDIVGVAGALGFADTGEAARAVEDACLETDPAQVDAALAALEATFARERPIPPAEASTLP